MHRDPDRRSCSSIRLLIATVLITFVAVPTAHASSLIRDAAKITEEATEEVANTGIVADALALQQATVVPAELEAIAQCESGGDYSAVNGSSRAGGKYQFLPSTWASVGGEGLPQDASPAEQDRLAVKLYANGAGRSHWVC